jgi:hypothetical protein
VEVVVGLAFQAFFARTANAPFALVGAKSTAVRSVREASFGTERYTGPLLVEEGILGRALR